MIANSDNVIHFELSLHDDDDFVLGATVPASVRRLSDGKFLMGAGTWQAAYTTINMVELTGNDGVKGRYFLDLAAQASTDIYMFRALFTFAGESKARVWEEQTDAEAFRLTAARAQILTDWIDGNRLDLLLDAVLADTGTDGVKLNATQPAGWAANLVASAGQVKKATVDTATNAHTPTTTEFQADDVTEATADHYNGRIIIFTSGVLEGQAKDITDYEAVGGIGQFTVTAFTEAPSNNDTFVIV